MCFFLTVPFVESLCCSFLHDTFDSLVSCSANLLLVLCLLGVERLLLLLGEKPSSSSPSEGAACERVQQKAAVTLARLSRDPDVAQTAIQLKGSAERNTVPLCILESIVLSIHNENKSGG